jgi:hypothetical protein
VGRPDRRQVRQGSRLLARPQAPPLGHLVPHAAHRRLDAQGIRGERLRRHLTSLPPPGRPVDATHTPKGAAVVEPAGTPSLAWSARSIRVTAPGTSMPA